MSNAKTIENHKIKKILTTTAVAGVAITAGAMATTNAHADAVPDANQQSATTQTTSSLSDLKAAQKASRQAYAQASSAQSSAQANYNQASNAIQAQSDAQTKLTSDQGLQSQAQANLNQSNELLSKAQSAALDNGFDVNSISAAQSTADAAQKAADAASAQAASTAAALSEAQKNAGQANTDLNNAKQAQTKANQTVTDAQNNVNTAQSNVDALTDQGAAIMNAAQKVSDAQTAKANADNDVKSKQDAVNTTETQLKNDQAKLDAATQTVLSNGDDSSNGNFRLDDQYNNMYNSYHDRLMQTQGEENDRIDNEMSAAILNFMHKWNPQNAQNQYLNDNDKIPASHTLTNLNDSYQSDPDLRRLLVKVGYPDYYTYEPTDPNNLHAPWKKVLGYAGVNRGLSSNASINATNYVLELINPIRQSRGLAPLTTDMNAISKSAEAVKEMVNLPALNWGENSQSALENHYNQEQKIAQKYGFTDYDTDSGNEGWFLHGHQLGQGPEVDENTLPDKGWLSVDNLHRALFEYAQKEAKGQDDGLIGDANFLLQSEAKSIAVQVGQDGNIYVFMFNPTKPSTDTTALQSAIAHDKQALGSAQQDLASAKSAAQQAAMALAKAQAAYSQLTNGAKTQQPCKRTWPRLRPTSRRPKSCKRRLTNWSPKLRLRLILLRLP